MKAIVLSGGGARGAYQVGVLKAIGELANANQIKNPFQFYSGVSAGAINASLLASYAEDFYVGTQNLVKLWSGISSDQVFKVDAVSISKMGFQWMGDLSFAKLLGHGPGRSLLDTAPLSRLISDNLNFSKIQENINSQVLKGLAITALDYKTSETITFLQGDPELSNWNRTRRRSEKATIQVEHIIASSAIPVLFPPGPVGNRYFGDGCVRNLSPLSPAIHSGANQLLVIGVRRQEEIAPPDVSSAPSNPSIAKIINVLLNAILLDGIEVDLERLARINEFIRRVPTEYQTNLNFKAVQYLFIQPSVEIGEIATKMASRMPRLLRYMLKGLGPLEDAKEIISYLLFESDFTNALIEVGYNDGMNAKEDILRFLLESQPQSLDWEGF
jgi:NTE family protein